MHGLAEMLLHHGLSFIICDVFHIICIDKSVQIGNVVLEFEVTVNLLVFMLPSAVSLELVIHWSQGPISGLQNLEQSIEMTSFDQNLLPLFDVRNLLAQSTQMNFPIDVSVS